MNLRIVTPLSVVFDEDVASLRAEDLGGSFGVLPGHAPFVTVLSIGVLEWHVTDGVRYCAVRGGMLSVDDGGSVAIATREAVVGDDITTLDAEVLARFQSEDDSERVENIETMRVQMNAIRHMLSRLTKGAGARALK